jgi:hypothetical protein
VREHTVSVYDPPRVEEEEETRQHLQPSYRPAIGYAANITRRQPFRRQPVGRQSVGVGWKLAKRMTITRSVQFNVRVIVTCERLGASNDNLVLLGQIRIVADSFALASGLLER